MSAEPASREQFSSRWGAGFALLTLGAASVGRGDYLAAEMISIGL